jgi:hypothetical protein
VLVLPAMGHADKAGRSSVHSLLLATGSGREGAVVTLAHRLGLAFRRQPANGLIFPGGRANAMIERHQGAPRSCLPQNGLPEVMATQKR